MAQQNPFDELLDQFKNLLKYVEDHVDVEKDQLTIPGDINERLRILQKHIDQYHRLSEDVIALSGVSKEEVNMRLQGISKEISQKGKELMNKTMHIKSEVENIKKRIESKLKEADKKVKEEAPLIEQKERELTDEQKTKKRKGKFKRFGSDEKWKPL